MNVHLCVSELTCACFHAHMALEQFWLCVYIFVSLPPPIMSRVLRCRSKDVTCLYCIQAEGKGDSIETKVMLF